MRKFKFCLFTVCKAEFPRVTKLVLLSGLLPLKDFHPTWSVAKPTTGKPFLANTVLMDLACKFESLSTIEFGSPSL